MKDSRRSFLKKVAYSAPVVVSLGMLVEPTDASASSGSKKSKVKKNKNRSKGTKGRKGSRS